MNKFVVYTAITKRYDTLKEPLVVNDKVDYICFTDNDKLESKIWKIVYIKDLYHKEPKILPQKYLEGYTHSLWIDGSCKLLVDPMILFDLVIDNSKPFIATFDALLWHCAYSEAIKCMEFMLDNPTKIKEQVAFMESEGYPKDNGLSVGTVIVRRHTKLLEDFSNLWWDMITRFSKRDQISINYTLWKLDIRQAYIPGSIYNNKYVSWGGHTHGNS